MPQPSLYDKLKDTEILAMLEMNHDLGNKMMAVFRRMLLSCKIKGVNPRDVAITGPTPTSDGRIMFKVKYGWQTPSKGIGK